eukprot:m51a1_g12301 hypothetical protein (314) ;mRNA; f:334487-335898
MDTSASAESFAVTVQTLCKKLIEASGSLPSVSTSSEIAELRVNVEKFSKLKEGVATVSSGISAARADVDALHAALSENNSNLGAATGEAAKTEEEAEKSSAKLVTLLRKLLHAQTQPSDDYEPGDPVRHRKGIRKTSSSRSVRSVSKNAVTDEESSASSDSDEDEDDDEESSADASLGAHAYPNESAIVDAFSKVSSLADAIVKEEAAVTAALAKAQRDLEAMQKERDRLREAKAELARKAARTKIVAELLAGETKATKLSQEEISEAIDAITDAQERLAKHRAELELSAAAKEREAKALDAPARPLPRYVLL